MDQNALNASGHADDSGGGHSAPVQLLRVLGLIFGLAVVVGGVVGAGILRAPGVVASALTSGPWILMAWAFGGVSAMLAAMPLVEAGASIPRAGGSYPIAGRAFGPTVGFVTGWLSWLQYVASNAFISVVFGEFAHRLGLAPGVPNAVLAGGLILAVTAINWIGTRVSGGSQSLGSAIKGGALVLLVLVLFLAPHQPVGSPVAVAVSLAPVTSLGALIMAVRVIYSTYAGWDGAIFFSEEVENPERNVARATFWGIGLVTVLYVLINAAALHVLTPHELAGSTLAVGDAAKRVLGPISDQLITLGSLISLAAIVNLQVMAASRITFAMARDEILPKALAVVAPGGSPRRSLLAVAVGSLAFAAIGHYEEIVRIYAPWSIGAILMVCLSAIKLRISEPDLPRPWKMPLFPWIAIAASLVQASLIAVMVLDYPLGGLCSALVVIAPLPYVFWRRRKLSGEGAR